MPRKREPARLKKEKARERNGRVTPETWYIRDFDEKSGKPIKFSTGCGTDDAGTAKAEEVLNRYLADKRAEAPVRKNRDNDEVLVSDVIALYADIRVDWKPGCGYKKPLSRPQDVIARLEKLLTFFGEMTVDEIDVDTCADFADECSTPEAGRRALEDLRSALNLALKRKLINRAVHVSLPDKLDPRSEYLERSEVAQLLWTAWRKRGVAFINGRRIDDYPIWKHLARYIQVAVYSGTRKSRIYTASFKRMPGRPYVDTKRGRYQRLAHREVAYKNKQAPEFLIPPRLLNHMERWERLGATYVIEYEGRAANPSRALRGLLRTLGRDDIVAHSLRHTCATWLMQNPNIALKDIAGFLGMTIDTLTRVYGKHRIEEQRVIGASFSGGANRPATLRKREQAENLPTVSDRNNDDQRVAT